MIQNESCRVVWSEDGARRRRSQPACRGHASHEDALDVQDAPVQRYRFEKSKLVLSHHMASRTIIIITHQHQHQHHHHHHHASASASTSSSSSSSSASSSRIITYHHVSSRISTYHHVSSRIITYQHVSAPKRTHQRKARLCKTFMTFMQPFAVACIAGSHIALTFQLLRFTRKRVPTSHHESLYSAHESASHRKPKCKTNRIKSMKNRRSKSKTNAFKMISHDLSRFHADLKAMFLTSWKTIDTPKLASLSINFHSDFDICLCSFHFDYFHEMFRSAPPPCPACRCRRAKAWRD